MKEICLNPHPEFDTGDPRIVIMGVKVMAVTPDWVAPEEQAARIKGYEELMSRRRTAKEINDSNAIKWGNVKVRVGPLEDYGWDNDDHFELEGK